MSVVHRESRSVGSGGNKPIDTVVASTTINENPRETRSRKRKLTGSKPDNRELETEQPAKRLRGSKKDTILASVSTPQFSRRQRNKNKNVLAPTPLDSAIQPMQATQEMPTPTPKPQRNARTKLSSTPRGNLALTGADTPKSRGRVAAQTPNQIRSDLLFNQPHIRQEIKEAQEDDDSDQDSDLNGDIGDIDREVERQNDSEAAKHFNEEVPIHAAQFPSRGHGGKNKTGDAGMVNDRSRQVEVGEDIEEALSSSEDDVPKPAPVTKKVQRMAAKLAVELPVVSTNDVDMPTPTSTLPQFRSAEPAWLPHTNLILKPSTDATWSYRLDLKAQNAQVRSVVKAARSRATLELVTNGEECGLQTSGLNAITLGALIQCADELGFDEDLDLSHRLEEGDHTTYARPLIKYVAQRVILERRTLKTGFSSVVLTAFGLDYSEEGIEDAKQLVANSDYIYQLLPSGLYDYARPFSHNVIHKYLSAALFSSTKYSKLIMSRKASIFVSSLPHKPLELELPKAMVAMASCVIHSILQDHAKFTEENFPPTGLHSQWSTFMAILTNLETASKVNYHKLMHKLYLQSSRTVAPTKHGLSQDQILQRINLTAFAANGGDDDSSSSSSESDPVHGSSNDGERTISLSGDGMANNSLNGEGSANSTGSVSGQDDEFNEDKAGKETEVHA
ncbi:uncharacterized protein C8R40DRAFT_1068353 [Lentinula edodes]|uniref:uncharacterized protein n=1 Tax=Lentinula edodes TaxID=5353 RepID=UPI001E8E7978|nr:uncharacterized protein C8R40DRAFT_1068353 [Lentinula edodes]KAH7876543.1 hypothetical protein C8R40DRAFT_1068353 [Lentinula edodes]